VLGRRGLHPVTRLVDPSVSEGVLRLAHRPVVIVRADDQTVADAPTGDHGEPAAQAGGGLTRRHRPGPRAGKSPTPCGSLDMRLSAAPLRLAKPGRRSSPSSPSVLDRCDPSMARRRGSTHPENS